MNGIVGLGAAYGELGDEVSVVISAGVGGRER
jgi:hypothetical protein